MSEIESTPLGQFRKKAVNTTIVLVCISIALVVAACICSGDAQANYTEYLSTTSEYETLDGSEYLERYNSSSSSSTLCMAGAALTFAAAMVSAVAWIGTNLLIANKRTMLATQKTIDKPMELDAYIGAIQAPIGSGVAFKEVGDTLVATNLVGEPIGALNKEFSDRIKAADQNETAKAFIISYHGDHPVIEITANA